MKASMQVQKGAVVFFVLSFLFAVITCHEKDDTLQVVGFVEHSESAGNKIENSQTLSGFHVTIGCRSADGKMQTMGTSKLDKQENFEVFLPQESVNNGVIRKECYAQVHSASNSHCPLHNSQEALNMIFQYKTREKKSIRHSGTLNFSPITCTSKFMWPFYKPIIWPIILHTPSQYPPTFTPESSLSPSDSPNITPFPQPENLSPPLISPSYNTPKPAFKHALPPHKHANNKPLPSPPKPKLEDFSPAPAPSFDPLSSPSPYEPLPLGPSPFPSFTIPKPPPVPE